MKLRKLLLILIIISLNLQAFCQINIDTDISNINWHHKDIALDSIPGISTDRAYNELLQNRKATKIIVAILDDGVDIEHEDLKENIWTNTDEIPDNGIDDDKNGYIDDIHGWNFLGNQNGENLVYDTWELTRIYKSLNDQFADIDTIETPENERKRYAEYLKIKEEFETTKANIKKMYDQWKNSKKAFDNYFEIVSKYTDEKKVTIELLESLEITEDTIAQKACNTLINWYKAGYSKQMVDLNYNSLRIKYEYKLNPDYDSRSIIGDDLNDLEEKYYGNSNVFVPGQFHGTSVAGIVGAIRSNNIGIDGITNSVDIMVVRAIPAGDERDKDVANAIYYAVDNGAQIINMSFNKPHSPNQVHVEKAIRYAEENGVLLITGSGNDGINIDKNHRYPNKYYSNDSECTTWITVGATSRNNDSTLIASFSNYGKESVDIMAPGVEITSLFPKNETILTEGASISAPMVSGVAALVWSYFPELKTHEIKTILLESVEYYGGHEVLLPGQSRGKILFKELSKTGGIVNAYRALILAKN